MFFAGAKTPASFPPETLPEAAFVGRSNVGKSSLLNALARFTQPARVSDKPGLTQQINFFTAGSHFHLVDMPGYGFAYAKTEAVETWQSTIDAYLSTRQTLKRVYLLIDARHGLKHNDKAFLEKLDQYQGRAYKVRSGATQDPRTSMPAGGECKTRRMQRSNWQAHGMYMPTGDIGHVTALRHCRAHHGQFEDGARHRCASSRYSPRAPCKPSTSAAGSEAHRHDEARASNWTSS
ncbi:P-loop containing nucleoside triphosphate hydrolase protein [Syncephalis pseudoplumigaleata]|uniref:P-loop containing nucleoside triphosphate hydrolase protein n=1 Tax=Syncephalis pseudoplumigaleata TaxID=1712513 RepID=A0A4P9YVV5_9FUNG|nr:P-loop containing nucleoside triphosphate hydrolase protein [Syncephalis pseudoplumigaleata]|eukprot:RKP23060.1 P-loop containing nucleoside triphosphate hydrolase protein [Syncephalis pseudoplumigaleata]